MKCIFCRIIKGELPARVVKETEEAIAFLDIDPIQIGHVLVLPKRHVTDLTEMTREENMVVMSVCQDVMYSIRKYYSAESITIMQNNGACMEVPHVHFHIIPRFSGDGFKLVEPDIDVSDFEMDEIARQLKNVMV
ncbi:HIT family protein [Paenisporosarcina sp.]|uniref:HIT family protein n=1 Tax=Paenisporosarcina sp. TaxID=1932001 RepID=UPI003C75E325